MTASGRMTRLMVTVFTLTSTEPGTKDTGRRTSSTERVSRHGLMVHAMKEDIKTVKKMVTVF